MATIQSVQEETAASDAADEANEPHDAAGSRAAAGERHEGARSTAPATTADDRASRRRPFLGPTAAATIIAALIASMTLAAVTAFNTLRSDILSVRTELRDEIGTVRAEIGSLETNLRAEIGSVRAEMRAEIGSLRTELHDFRTEVGTVLLDHAERLARIEALLLNGAVDSNQQS